jgi:tight adherence protein B
MTAGIFATLGEVLAFILAVVAFQFVAARFFRSADAAGRVNRRLTMLAKGMETEEVYARLVRKSITSDGAPAWMTWIERLQRRLDQAGLNMHVGRFCAIVAAIAGGLWICAYVLATSTVAASPSSMLLSVIGVLTITLLGVTFWINSRREKRLKQIEEQLPWALDVITRALRAGHPVLSAVNLASKEIGDPIGTELGLVVDATTYGAEFKDTLRAAATRTGSADIYFFAVAVGVQSETGGNLAEILDGLSEIIRSRNALGQKVKAMSGEGKATAWLLTALPVGLLAFELTVNPRFYLDKVNDPIFWPAVAVLLTLFVVGWVWMNRLINFKF